MGQDGPELLLTNGFAEPCFHQALIIHRLARAVCGEGVGRPAVFLAMLETTCFGAVPCCPIETQGLDWALCWWQGVGTGHRLWLAD